MVSSGVSAGGSKSILGAQIGEAGGWERWGGRKALIRIISSDADDFATIRGDTTRGHLDNQWGLLRKAFWK